MLKIAENNALKFIKRVAIKNGLYIYIYLAHNRCSRSDH